MTQMCLMAMIQSFEPKYNIAPTDLQSIVRLARDTGERELAAMRWGLIPYWSKNAKVAFSIDAKAETITASPVFRGAFKRPRCLVPADLFYEWAKLNAKTKQPYAIAMKDGSIFACPCVPTLLPRYGCGMQGNSVDQHFRWVS